MITKKIIATLSIATLTIFSLFAQDATFVNANFSGGDSKQIVLKSTIEESSVVVKLQYNTVDLTADLTGFNISSDGQTDKFDIVFSSRLNQTKEFSIEISPGEFIGEVDDNTAFASGVTPSVKSARSDTVVPAVKKGTYTTFASNKFTTNLYPGLNSSVSGADFILEWTGNPNVPSGIWTSTNIITVTSI